MSTSKSQDAKAPATRSKAQTTLKTPEATKSKPRPVVVMKKKVVQEEVQEEHGSDNGSDRGSDRSASDKDSDEDSDEMDDESDSQDSNAQQGKRFTTLSVSNLE